VRFNLPAVATAFTGREAELNALDDALRRGGRAVVSQAIAGLCGVGKSQHAARYIQQRRRLRRGGVDPPRDRRPRAAQEARARHRLVALCSRISLSEDIALRLASITGPTGAPAPAPARANATFDSAATRSRDAWRYLHSRRERDGPDALNGPAVAAGALDGTSLTGGGCSTSSSICTAAPASWQPVEECGDRVLAGHVLARARSSSSRFCRAQHPIATSCSTSRTLRPGIVASRASNPSVRRRFDRRDALV
jgi:hypothetical protein